MEYLTVDKIEYHALSDGLTFKMAWDAGRSNFRIDYMSITESRKTDPTDRAVIASQHLRDILPATYVQVRFDYFAQDNDLLRIITQAIGDGLYREFRRNNDTVDLVPAPMERDAGREVSAVRGAILQALSGEQHRRDIAALAVKRASYRIAFSNVTSDALTLTASGGPQGATGDWDMQFKLEAFNRWTDVPSQSGANAHVFNVSGLRAGGRYQFQVRRGTEPWSNTFTRVIPPRSE